MNPSREEAQAVKARLKGVEAAQPSAAAPLWRAFAAAATPEAFCRTWLALQCSRLAGVAAGVVVLQSPGSEEFAPAAFWPEAQAGRTHLAEATERAIRLGQGVVLPVGAAGAAGVDGADDRGDGRDGPDDRDASDAASGQHVGDDAPRYHLAYPIMVAGELRGVVAVDIALLPGDLLESAVEELQWGAGWLEVLLRRGHGDPDALARTRVAFVVTLFAAVLDQPNLRRSALACVTELATFLDCDRVALGTLAAGRVRLAALSHTAQFDAHSNLARAIEAAMQEAVDQRERVVYPLDDGARGGAPMIHAHDRLAHAFDAGAIVSVPLPSGERVVGALTLERAAARPFEPPALQLLESVAALLGPIVELYEARETPLVEQLKARLRRGRDRLFGPAAGGLKLAALSGAALALILLVGTGTYRVTAETVIEGSVQRVVTAPFNGFVREVAIRPGDTVTAGQVLGRLDDRDMQLERLKVAAQRDERANLLREAMAGHERAQISVVAAQLAQAEAQLALYDQQLERVALTAPFDGVVVRGDLSRSLGEPVERGQVLFEVAPLGSYRVVLEVDERDIGAIALGQHGELTLSAMPGTRLPFTVTRITPVNTAREGRNYFRVEAHVDTTTAALRPGMEGVAKVDAGRARLAWIWTHELVNWARLALWSWLP